ncbi:MAG: hypothetical protein HDP28_01450 [Clostridia bacterium]|nr:hypothetical protein [Clostridia bacterium]
MESAIEELYYGDFGGQANVKISKQYTKKADRAERFAKNLTELLKENAEAKEAFEKFREANEDAVCIELCDYYKAGFKNAVRLMTDSLGEE